MNDVFLEDTLHLEESFSLIRGGLVSLQTATRRVLNSLLWLFLLTAVIGTCPVPTVHAQASDRKVKTKVQPDYPDIARKMGLSGTVRLQIVVAPNGVVKDTKVIGGHPILVNAAVDAVKKWRFESATEETTKMVEFKFEPGS
jgi:protein TonB